MPTLSFLDSLWQDIRFGARMLRKNPGFTAIAVLTLALGIGASTAVFSLIDAVLLRVAPYKDSQQLVFIFTPVPKLLPAIEAMVALNGSSTNFQAYEIFNPSGGDFNDMRTQSHSFSEIAMFGTEEVNLATGGNASRVHRTEVTGDFFSLFRVSPEVGRAITPEDARPGAEAVAVISHNLWESRFGADRNIIGKIVQINTKPYRIVGITPRSFQFPFDGDLDATTSRQSPTDIWISSEMTAQDLTDYGDGGGNAVARLRPGVSAAQAQAEIAAILAHSEEKRDPMMRGEEAMVMPFAGTINQSTKRPMFLLLGAVSLVLLIACSNTAGLLMARATMRLHEFSLRAALGAHRSRIVRQLLTEAVLLASGAAALGIFLAYGAVRAVIWLSPGNTARLGNAQIDGTALVFTIGLALVTSILFGTIPAMSFSRVQVYESIQQSAGRSVKGISRRLHEGLIVVEVGLCVLLLAGSGLFIRSLVKVNSVDKGFQTHAILTARISLDDHYAKPEQRVDFFHKAMAQIQQLPGTEVVAAADRVPLDSGESLTFLKVEDHPYDSKVGFESRSVSSGYFSTLGIPLLQGRAFTETDDAKHPEVAIVNRSLARKYFPAGAVGKHLWNVRPDGQGDEGSGKLIVGVVPDVRQYGLEGPSPFQVYGPLWMNSLDRASIVVRTTVPPATLASGIREVVRSLDSAVPVDDIRTMDDRVTSATAARRFQTMILTAFAAIALFLSLVGLYALMAYSVKQRTSEIGVRMALGAKPASILRLILTHGIKLAIFGALLGLAGGFALSRVVAKFLFGVRPLDPLTLAATVALLLVVALFACIIPAKRAAGVDPMVALRHE